MESIMQSIIMEKLEQVKDPEIPSVSVLNLGMIEEVLVEGNGLVKIKALPTFLGCPALEIIQKNIQETVKSIESVRNVEVEFIFDPPWTSDRVTKEGKAKLKQVGIAFPPMFNPNTGVWDVECPYCGSHYTTLENLFGPTACKSILYCKNCKNPFEAMKPISNFM